MKQKQIRTQTSIQLERQYKHVQVEQRRIEMLKERKNLNWRRKQMFCDAFEGEST
jgi:hypothetical protein